MKYKGIPCPLCQEKGIRITLTMSEANYSGTGENMMNCPRCGKGFAISYKVDLIQRAPDWDVDPKEL